MSSKTKVDLFSPNPSSKGRIQKNYSFEINIKENQENQESINEERNLNKLSLRKKKVNDFLHSKRYSDMSILNTIKILSNDIYGTTEHIIFEYEKKDFLSGDIYIKLKKAYESKDEKLIQDILNNIFAFTRDKKLDNIEIKELLLKCGSNITNKQITKNEKFPMASLLFNIGLNTENKYIYIYCFNQLLNFSFISNDFCKDIYSTENINLILEKLIHFYPLFIDSNVSNNLDELNSLKKVETFFIGGQILKLLGNLYLATDDHEAFQLNNINEKIFYLLYSLNLEEENSKYKPFYYEFLETLIWLITLFIEKDENLILNYKDQILMIIPQLLEDIKKLYFTKANFTLEKILEFLLYLCGISSEFVKQLVDADGIKTLLNLFAHLFNYNPRTDCDIELNSYSHDIILNILISVFCLDSKYLKFFEDYSTLALILEKLINRYKLHEQNHNEIQKKIINILSNLAGYNDIDDIIKKILLNKNIIMNIFKYFYIFHEFDTIFFISNVMERQMKNVRDFLINLGALDIIINSICKSQDFLVIKISIKALYQLIKAEKLNNIRLLFEQLYKTAVPEKIKELVYDKNINNEIDSDKFIDNNNENIPNIFKKLINDFDAYEESMDYD